MSHDVLAAIFVSGLAGVGWLLKVLIGVVRDILHRLRLHTVILYHLTEAEPLPDKVREELIKRMANGR